MADGPAASLSDVGEDRLEVRKEALTMALYVAICLMASLIVIPESAEADTTVRRCGTDGSVAIRSCSGTRRWLGNSSTSRCSGRRSAISEVPEIARS